MKQTYSDSIKFFDEHKVLLPWPDILRRDNFGYLYKPREVWWNKWVEGLGLKRGQKILEIGCGRGIFLDRVTGKYGIKASGIDIAEKAISDAKKESIYKHDFRAGNAEKLPFANNIFDVVISFDTLEHITNQEKAIEEMARVLKPKGKIMIYTINSKQNFTWDNLLSKMGLDIYSKVNHDPKLFINPQWLEREFFKNKIKIKKIEYFDAFFSLIIDETVMLFLEGWQRIFGWEKTKQFAKIILGVLNIFSRIITPILIFLDLPWTIWGHSNSFLFLGEKE